MARSATALLLALALALLLAAPAPAQPTPGACALGTAQADLAISDVKARVFNTGGLFYGNATVNGTGYLVPKGTNRSPIFAAGLWVGGLVGGELRAAGSTYDRFEFWPGPLDGGGALPDPSDCSAYDRIWTVNALDLQHYEATGEATVDLAEWPVGLGAPAVDAAGAPVEVTGRGQVIDLAAGERPLVYGHEVAFWVMNDVGNAHRKTLTPPIGLEVRATAFASAEGGLEQQTLYRYEMVYRGSEPLEDAYLTLFSDPDLGDASDDYVGADSARGMAFVYNGLAADAVYGSPPPAVGYDLLSGGASSSMYFVSGGNSGMTDPWNGVRMYHFMRGLWGDGTPLTEGGVGYETGGPVTTWAFPGDPEPRAFWSEVNVDGSGGQNQPGDRRHLLSAGPFTMQPGESRAFDLAILFATGSDHLHSVTALKGLSDAVQARYDAGDLFVPGPEPPPPGALATPQLLAPEDGTFFVGEPALLEWAPVAGAEHYRVEVTMRPDFADPTVYHTAGTSLEVAAPYNEEVVYRWRVVATAGLERSHPSEARSVRLYRYAFVPDGAALVEVAHPAGDPCAGAPADPGCQEHGGNTVWLDSNATGEYYASVYNTQYPDAPPALLGAQGLLQHFSAVVEEGAPYVSDFEVRFTASCATAGACLGVYAQPPNPASGARTIASVPFELWFLGYAGPEDDVRMIPFIRANTFGEEYADWANTFTATQASAVGEGEVPVTEQIYWMVPDRPDGYARFEQAALGFGGVGASYDPSADGDDQVDPDPRTGAPCALQGYYVDFCFNGGGTFVAPLSKLVLADLAGSGETPPAGTAIRFHTNDPLYVGTEEAPSAPSSARLLAPYPNPSRAGAVVPFEVERAGPVRLAVYDVLGRRVAVLVDGAVPAGRHEGRVEGRGLAGGVYVVVLEAEGARASRRLVILR